MKKSILIAAGLFFSSILFAQDKPAQDKPAPENQKGFTGAIGVGLGMYTESPTLINASIGLMGEGWISKSASIYGKIDYNRIFLAGESGSAGILTAYVGPRVYFSEKIFAGVGAGYAYFTGDGASGGTFSFNPHVGFNMKASQVILEYKGFTSSDGSAGMIGLGFFFKFGKK
jgi:hypothetical protein